MNEEPSSLLKVAIIGAGGIGCYYGARLQTAGHKVKFVARGAHLDMLQSSGLTLDHPDFKFFQPVDACSLDTFTERNLPNEFDAIVVCVKATSTKAIAIQLKYWFQKYNQKTALISLQNGVDNESIFSDSLGLDCVVGGLAVRIGGHVISPGMVKATGVAQLILGSWPNEKSPTEKRFGCSLLKWVSLFNNAKIPARKVADIRKELWRKLVINNGVNPLSALTRMDTKTLSHHPHFGPIVHQLMQEAAKVAIADGEKLTEKDAFEMYQLIRSFDPIKTSMLVDIEKGKVLELEEIGGAVIKRANGLGVLVPYTQTIYALLNHSQIESKTVMLKE